MPMLPKAVSEPPMVTFPEIEATPTNSKATSGEEVLIPTRLLVVSTLKTLESTLKSEETDRLVKVLVPETVRVSEVRLAELRVRGPRP